MDNKGRVTVVLHWDQRQGGSGQGASASGNGFGASGSGASTSSNIISQSDKYSPSKKSFSTQNSIDKSGGPLRYPSPQITVINHDDDHQGGPYYGGHYPESHLPNRSCSFDGSTPHIHTVDCGNRHHTPTRAGSPSNDNCDFHCCALHEEGRQIAVHKSVATSPIQDGSSSPQPASSLSDPNSLQRRSSANKGHVRFLDIAPDRDSSESETENTVMEEEQGTSEKFLLLIDQLSVDQKRHLTIKDIGIILERLTGKIIDVDRLERENESDDCYNWTIKATIRGDVMRELGVIYNGNYYAISEHPGYKGGHGRVENDEEDDEEEEEEEEEDDEERL